MNKRPLKFAVAIALLALLVYEADWSQAARVLPRLSLPSLLFVFAAMFAGLVVSACKWSFALRIQGLQFPFRMLLRVLCTGFFFNSFLPTAIGGDAYRVYRTLPADGYPTRAFAAVALERVVGFLALLALGTAAALVLMHRSHVAHLYLIAALLGSVTLLIAIVAVRSGWIERLVARWRHRAPIDALLHSIALLRQHPQDWLPLVGLSFTFQVMSIGIVYMLFRDVTPLVTASQCALITAFVGISAAMPISINGIGVMEGAFVATAVALNLDYELALVVAVERRFISLLLSAACGVSYLLEARRDKRHTGVAPSTTCRQDEPSPRVPLDLQPPATPWDFASILEFTNDSIIVWEMDGRGILYWNQAAEQLYGYRREEALGHSTHELLRTHVPGGVHQLENMITRYGVWAGELRHTTRDGRQISVDGRLALMSQENGRWLVLEVNRDLTDRVRAQATQAAMAAQFASLRTHLQR